MEPETGQAQPVKRDSKLRPIYWLAAAAMTISVVMEAMTPAPDWMAIAGRGSLIAACVLLATAKTEETRTKKILIYALTAVALGLLLARIMNR